MLILNLCVSFTLFSFMITLEFTWSREWLQCTSVINFEAVKISILHRIRQILYTLCKQSSSGFTTYNLSITCLPSWIRLCDQMFYFSTTFLCLHYNLSPSPSLCTCMWTCVCTQASITKHIWDDYWVHPLISALQAGTAALAGARAQHHAEYLKDTFTLVICGSKYIYFTNNDYIKIWIRLFIAHLFMAKVCNTCDTSNKIAITHHILSVTQAPLHLRLVL